MNEVKEVEWATVASIFTLEAEECMWDNLKVLEILDVISFLQKLWISVSKTDNVMNCLWEERIF